MDLNIERFYKSFPTLSHRRNRFPWEKSINYNMKMGEITPICAIPVAPGVTYNLDLSTVIKVAPLQQPPQDDAVFKAFAFYNANRNEWENYPYWFGEKKNPEDPENEQTYVVPKVVFEKVTENGTTTDKTVKYNSFYDNIGCVPEVEDYSIDAYLPRIDRDIYNNYFRNQALENPLTINRTDSNDDPLDNMDLRKICKPRDLFTSLLPTATGDEVVEIPLGSSAPVSVFGTGKTLGLTNGTTNGGINSYIPGSGVWTMDLVQKAFNVNATSTQATTITGDPITGQIGVVKDGKKSGLTGIADLSQAVGAPLEGLYQAIAYNTYNYIKSRGGNRYFEQLSNIYGITNPEGVLRIPEFLGSVSQYIDFDTVTQTSSTNGEATPLGNRASNGYMQNYGSIINKSFGEFGWIIVYGVVTHYPKYQQGVSKLMQTEDPLDLFNPIFNLMGDEPVYRSEIYTQGSSVVNSDGDPVDDEVMGYTKRNARWLYPINEIHGEQRSSYAQSLDTNHFAENFASLPKLNKTFDKVNDNAFKRCLQVTNETQFVCNSLVTGTIDIEIPLQSIPSPFPDVQISNI